MVDFQILSFGKKKKTKKIADPPPIIQSSA